MRGEERRGEERRGDEMREEKRGEEDRRDRGETDKSHPLESFKYPHFHRGDRNGLRGLRSFLLFLSIG